MKMRKLVRPELLKSEKQYNRAEDTELFFLETVVYFRHTACHRFSSFCLERTYHLAIQTLTL